MKSEKMKHNKPLMKLIWTNYFKLKSECSRYILIAWFSQKFELSIWPMFHGN